MKKNDLDGQDPMNLATFVKVCLARGIVVADCGFILLAATGRFFGECIRRFQNVFSNWKYYGSNPGGVMRMEQAASHVYSAPYNLEGIHETTRTLLTQTLYNPGKNKRARKRLKEAIEKKPRAPKNAYGAEFSLFAD